MTATRAPLTAWVVGAGAVGTAFALGLQGAGYRITAVGSRNTGSARSLARRVGGGVLLPGSVQRISLPDIILIAVPDHEIASVAKRLAGDLRRPHRPLCILHTSGATPSDVLAPFAQHGGAIGSLHPIQSFPSSLSPKELAQRLLNISYGFEGDRKAGHVARKLVKAFGGRFIHIPKEQKILYHTSCVIASNYAVALIGLVEQAAGRVTGLRPNDLRPLMEASIETAFTRGAADALTGPIVRGSVETILRHRAAIASIPEFADVYRALGLAVLDLAVHSGRLSPNAARQVRRALQKRIVPHTEYLPIHPES